MLKVVRAVGILLALAAPAAHADWHSGKVTTFKVGDGQTITF